MEHEDNVDQRLSDLRDKAGDFLDTCELRSANRLYQEVARVAKSEGRVIQYLHGVFHQMDIALSLLEPTRTREFALELIAYLESEEHARKLQPDFPDEEYENTCYWMTACAYENLAEATGRTDGYNSEGMHTCITDGIDVCRRTGKMACVRCFREYATEVYSAADDIPMALHHSRSISSHTGPWSNRGDRRWLGVKNEAWLMLLTGQTEKAFTELRRALPLTQEEEVGVKNQSRLEVLADLEQLLVLTGKIDPSKPSPAHRSLSPKDFSKQLAKDEWPWLDQRHAHIDALRACCRGEHVEAQKILATWDRKLNELKHLSDWFEIRLRLIAACRLGKQDERAEALAKQLDLRARKARDWLTLRRLARLMDKSAPVSPLALLAPLTEGPFASQGQPSPAPVEAPVSETNGAAAPSEAPAPEPVEEGPPPLDGFVLSLVDRLDDARNDDDVREEMLDQLLSVPAADATHQFDATRLVHLAHYLMGDASRGEEIWNWAESIAARHPQEASVLNLLAVLGDLLRSTEEELEEIIDKERIEKLFRVSLDLDPFHVRNHSRAGAYHLGVTNLGEAERCLARGFRLERSNSFVALRLAEVYRQTERPRDALAVLDMALREDADDPEVAHDAGLLAFNLKQWDGALMYFDVREGMEPDQEWTHYYRTIALLELDRPVDALEAIEEEGRRCPAESQWKVVVLRACAHAAMNDVPALRQGIEAALAQPFYEIEFLTLGGVTNMCARLWQASLKLPKDDPLRGRLNERLLLAGLAQDDYFEIFRERGEKQEGVNYYRCLVRQPLDERWSLWPGRLSDQENWTAYYILWGVLAASEEEAEERVLKWQSKCYPLPAEVLQTEIQNEDYTDKPGVVWQGERWDATPDEDEDDDIEVFSEEEFEEEFGDDDDEDMMDDEEVDEVDPDTE
jgi:tetratricopeptide (TPR) repeat protein